LPAAGLTNVRIVGVGGAGCNAVSRMLQVGVRGVEFLAINTDSQALARCEARTRLHIGQRVVRHLGTGGNPELGRRAAEENGDELAAALGGADMVFVTYGLGGGTGTGAGPVVADLARKAGALTVAVVTLPFSFEGPRRRRIAEEGLARLREAVDALILVPNDRLLALAGERMTLVDAFRRADDLLRYGVQGVADLVTVPGLINLDFADVRAVMQNAGLALMGIGEGKGEGRALQAARAAMNSPLLETSVAGATRVLLNITGGPNMTLHEVSEAAQEITAAVDPEANIIFGAVVAPQPETELRVTLIATGIPEAPSPPRPALPPFLRRGPPPGERPPGSERRPPRQP